MDSIGIKVRLKPVGSCFILQFPSMTINFTYPMLQKFGWLPVLPALSEIGADPAPAKMFNQVLDFQHIISQIKMRNLFHKFDINGVRSPVVFLRRFSNISPFHSNSFTQSSKSNPFSDSFSHLPLFSQSDRHSPAQCSQLPLKGPENNET